MPRRAENITATEIERRWKDPAYAPKRMPGDFILESFLDRVLTIMERLGMVERNPHFEDITAKARGDSNGCD